MITLLLITGNKIIAIQLSNYYPYIAFISLRNYFAGCDWGNSCSVTETAEGTLRRQGEKSQWRGSAALDKYLVNPACSLPRLCAVCRKIPDTAQPQLGAHTEPKGFQLTPPRVFQKKKREITKHCFSVYHLSLHLVFSTRKKKINRGKKKPNKI